MGRLLVDSNCYLRLARQIPTLLGIHGKYELRVLPRFDEEYLRSPRLQSKFTWPKEPPHPEERKKWAIPTSREQRREIDASRPTVAEFAEESLKERFEHKRRLAKDGTPLPFLSPQDLTILTHAITLKTGILTDEAPLTKAARDVGVEVVNSLTMLRYLLGQKVVVMTDVEAIVRYWQFDDDTPYKDWEQEYTKRFKKPPPRYTGEDDATLPG